MLAQYIAFLQGIFFWFPFNIIDVVILLAFIVYIKQERMVGLLESGIGLGKALCIFVVTILFYSFFSSLVIQILPVSKALADSIAWILLFVATGVILWVVSQRVTFENEEFSKEALYSVYITGAISFCIYLSMVLVPLISFPTDTVVKNIFTRSFVSRMVLKSVFVADANIKKIVSGYENDTIIAAIYTSSDGGERTVWQHATAISDTIDTAERMADRLNRFRQQNTFKKLKTDRAISQISAEHAQDILESGILSTHSSTHISAYDRFVDHGLLYSLVREIVVLAPSDDLAMTALLSYKQSREILENPQLSVVGIGVIHTQAYGTIYVFDFAR